jgi:autotransporter-associated beta strand protein
LQIGNGGTSGSAGAGAITNNGTLSFNRSDTISPASFSGSGAIQQDGTGTLVFSGPSSFSGPLNINNGTVAGLHANAFGSTPNITITANGTLSLRGDASTNFTRVSDSQPYSIVVPASGATINVDQATVAGSAPKTMTIGTITATQTTPAFTLNFTGANNTSLSVGAISGPPATQGFATTTINNLNTSGTTTIASYTGNNTVGNETVNIVSTGDTIITGAISDPASLWPLGVNKAGNGRLTLLGASTYSNGTVITAGVVAIGNDNAFGIGAVNINAPDAVGVLQSTDSTTRTIPNDITNSSQNFTFGGTGNLVFNGANWNKGQFFKNLIVQTPLMTINNAITSTAGANQGFSKEGTGTLVLAGANTYMGDTLVRQGTLTVAPTGSLGNSAFGLEVSNNNATAAGTNTVINLNNTADTVVGNLSGFINVPTSGTNTATINTGGSGINLNITQTTALTAPAGIAGAGNVVLSSGSTAALTLTGNLTYSGSTTVSGGALRLQTNLTNTSSVSVDTSLELTAGGGSNRVLRSGTVSVGPTGKVNLQDNKAILTAMPAGSWNGSAYTGVTGLVATGKGTSNNWDGPNGIVTTQTQAIGTNLTTLGVAKASDVRPATATATALWAGQTITGSDVLVMYTYGGDATLDGKINIDDYVKIDSGIAGGYQGWSNGDFNYDGKVSIDDYITVIDANIGNQNGIFPTGGGIDLGGGGVSGVSAVPEPASLTLLAAGAACILGRRRRRDRDTHAAD